VKSKYLKTVYNSGNLENVLNLIDYLKSIGGKELKQSCRRQNAFKTSWPLKEEKLRARCHIQNAIEYLHSIKNEFSGDQINTVVADIAKYVKLLDSNEDTDFILLSSNTLPSAIHFGNARSLFYLHKIPEKNNNYDTDLIVIYAIRLSLESRIKGLLGIDYVTENGIPIGLAKLIKVSKELKSVKYSDKFNWIEIQWVNEWLNHHLHRLLRPYPWVIHQAIEVLQPFLSPKEPIINQHTMRYSFYSASIVENEKIFKTEVETALNLQGSNINIQWKFQQEVMMIPTY
jgi:hypothetical protein